MRSFRTYSRPITVLVAALTLFGTSGMGLSRMTCLLAGHTVLSLGTADDCCPEEAHGKEPSVKAECCVLGVAKPDAEPFMSAASVELPVLATLESRPPAIVAEVVHRAAAVSFGRAPPLLLPTERLALLSVFRV